MVEAHDQVVNSARPQQVGYQNEKLEAQCPMLGSELGETLWDSAINNPVHNSDIQLTKRICRSRRLVQSQRHPSREADINDNIKLLLTQDSGADEERRHFDTQQAEALINLRGCATAQARPPSWNSGVHLHRSGFVNRNRMLGWAYEDRYEGPGNMISLAFFGNFLHSVELSRSKPRG